MKHHQKPFYGQIGFLVLALVVGYVIFVDLLPKCIRFYDNNEYIYFLNVGNADSILIKSKTQHLFLIDGGADNTASYRLDQVLPFWINKIDIILVTHPHVDHYGGLIDIIEKYSTQCIFYEHLDYEMNQTHKNFNKTVVSNVPIDTIYRRKSYQRFLSECVLPMDFNIEILNQNEVYIQKNPNNYSIVTKYRLGTINVLLMADAEYEMQAEMLNLIDTGDINIIKVPHQGSKDALNIDFINKLHGNNIAIFSVGPNSYGHPHQKVLNTYDMLKFKVYRTDYVGSIVCSNIYIDTCIKL